MVEPTGFIDVQQNARIQKLELRVQALLQHLGIPDPAPPDEPGVSAEVASLAREGKTMHAVKLDMDETGWT
jgi:hypothetical protein